MENVVSIIKSRDNELEFDISIQGVEDEGTQVRFVIDAEPAALVFNCTHKEDDKWVVTVPPMPQIEAKSYDFRIEIVVSGYFFTPFNGTINVTNEPEVKSSGVGAPMVAPVVSGSIKVNGEAAEEKEMKAEEPTKAEEKEEKVVAKAEKKEEKKEEPKKEEKKAEPKPIPDDYKDLADQLISKHKEKKSKETEQGKKVKDIIKSVKKDEPKKEEKKVEKKAEPNKAPEPKKEEKKPAPKPKKKVKESGPIIPRHSNLNAAIEELKKPPVLSEQAKKVQDILKNLH